VLKTCSRASKESLELDSAARSNTNSDRLYES